MGAESYINGLREVTLGRREIIKSFASIDLLITPVTGGVAGLMPSAAAGAGNPPPGGGGGGRGGATGFGNTSYFSYYGLPALSIPCGFTASGLPIGLQISGAPFAESTVLALAHAYEQATGWHARHPNLAV